MKCYNVARLFVDVDGRLGTNTWWIARFQIVRSVPDRPDEIAAMTADMWRHAGHNLDVSLHRAHN